MPISGVEPKHLSGRFGQFNQAGDLAPKTGPYSETLEAHEGTLNVDQHTVFMRRGFFNFIGGVQLSGVHQGAIVGKQAYNGSAPSALQPTTVRPLPWAPFTTPTMGE